MNPEKIKAFMAKLNTFLAPEWCEEVESLPRRNLGVTAMDSALSSWRQPARDGKRPAMDSASAKGFLQRFPAAARIGQAYGN